MQKPSLKDLLKDRFLVFLDLGLKSRVEIATLVGQDVKTLNNWKRAGFTLEKARRLARSVGLSERFFTDPAEVFAETDPLSYFNQEEAQPDRKAIGFTGRTTHALAAFLEYNAGLLENSFIRIAAFGAPVLTLPGYAITSHVAGYQRSIVVPAVGDFGGSNAIFEDFRISSFEILLGNETPHLNAPKGTFPCPSDDFLRQHRGAMTQFLVETGLPMETIHVCARTPSPETFHALMHLMNRHRRDFALMECALDAVKAFAPFFVTHTAEAGKALNLIVRFIMDFAKVEDAAQAVCYAIEALPFCAFTLPQHRHLMTALAEEILSGRGRFAHATPDMRIAADVARSYLPFVSNPEEFEHVPMAWSDSAPGFT